MPQWGCKYWAVGPHQTETESWPSSALHEAGSNRRCHFLSKSPAEVQCFHMYHKWVICLHKARECAKLSAWSQSALGGDSRILKDPQCLLLHEQFYILEHCKCGVKTTQTRWKLFSANVFYLAFEAATMTLLVVLHCVQVITNCSRAL